MVGTVLGVQQQPLATTFQPGGAADQPVKKVEARQQDDAQKVIKTSGAALQKVASEEKTEKPSHVESSETKEASSAKQRGDVVNLLV